MLSPDVLRAQIEAEQKAAEAFLEILEILEKLAPEEAQSCMERLGELISKNRYVLPASERTNGA